jgi:hypothetical protein
MFAAYLNSFEHNLLLLKRRIPRNLSVRRGFPTYTNAYHCTPTSFIRFGGSHRFRGILAFAAAVSTRRDSESTDDDDAAASITIKAPVDEEIPEKVSELALTPKLSRGFWQQAWKLVSYLGWDTAVLVLAAGIAVGAAVLGVIGPVAVGQLWEAFSGPASDGLSVPAVKLISAYVGRFLLQWLSSSMIGAATENAACRLREAIFGALLELDVAYFDAHSTAELAGPLSDDVKELRDALRSAISDGLPAAVRAIGGVACMLVISPSLAAVLGAAIPIAAYAGSQYASHLRDMSRKSQDAQIRAAAVSLEGLSNIRTVRAFTAESMQRQQYHEAITEYSSINKQLGREITLFNGAMSLGMSALAGLVLLFGGQMVQVSFLNIRRLLLALCPDLSTGICSETLYCYPVKCIFLNSFVRVISGWCIDSWRCRYFLSSNVSA